MSERERLIELINQAFNQANDNYGTPNIEQVTDYLLDNGVIVTPCIAMVEQFIKDGKFDKKHRTHNGRIAVVYIDKSKSGMPLIDITEQHYNVDKAVKRIKALKGGATNE